MAAMSEPNLFDKIRSDEFEAAMLDPNPTDDSERSEAIHAVRQLLLGSDEFPGVPNIVDEVLRVVNESRRGQQVYIVTEHDDDNYGRTVGEPWLFADRNHAQAYCYAMNKVRDAEAAAEAVWSREIGMDRDVNNRFYFRITQKTLNNF